MDRAREVWKQRGWSKPLYSALRTQSTWESSWSQSLHPRPGSSEDRTLLPPNLHRSVSLAPGLSVHSAGFVSGTSYLHTQCCRQPRYRYATSFVKFTYWRKYEVRKSQKHSQEKNQVAWRRQPCCSSAGRKVPSMRGG